MRYWHPLIPPGLSPMGKEIRGLNNILTHPGRTVTLRTRKVPDRTVPVGIAQADPHFKKKA